MRAAVETRGSGMTGGFRSSAAMAKAAATRAARVKPKLTRKQAMDAMCRGCICDELAGGTWRQQVDACRATECPMHEHRPRSAAPLEPAA